MGYLETLPSRALLVGLVDGARITPRDLLGGKGTPRAEPGQDDSSLPDYALVDATSVLPVFIDR